MKVKQLLAAALLFCTAGASAQTDVTSTYIQNAGFDDCTAETSDVAAKTIKDYSSNGWTNAAKGSFTTIAVTAYGGGKKVGNSTTPSTKKDGTTVSGNTIGIIAGWGDDVKIQSKDITLPAGFYTLTIDHYLTSSTNNYSTSRFGFVTASNSYIVASTTFTASTWTTETVTFTLTESTTGKIQIGLLGNNKTGSGAPAVFYDDVKLTYTDPLKAAKDALQAEIDKAKLCDAKEGLADAITAAESALTNATTADELANALATLQAADKDAVLRYDNGLADATYAAPVATSFVVNGTFDSGITPWQRTGTYQNNKTANNQSGAFTGNFYENWNGSAQANKMYQTISNIPNGTYRLDIAAFVNTLADPNESQYVFANNDKTYLTTGAPTAYEVYTVVTNNQIEIGLEQTTATANWMGIDNVSLRYYGAGDVINDAKNASHKLAWEEAKAAAEAAVANTDYQNVTGAELTAINAEIAKDEPTTADGYDEAAAALTTATSTFTAAKAAYDAYASFLDTYLPSEPLAYATNEKWIAIGDAYGIGQDVTDAADATAKVEAAKTALRAYYESHAMAEGVEDAVNMTSLLAAANADTNTGWTNGIGTNQGQGYTDSEGNVASKYLDGGWAANAGANIDMTRSVEIPAGKYLLTVKARGAVNLDVYTLSIAGETINLPHANGNSNGVFGNGWEDASIEFETQESGTQTLEIKATSTASQQWISLNDFRLIRLELYTEMADADDYAALNDAIESAEAKPLGFDKDEYAPYNNVAALKAIATAKAIDQNAENAKDDVTALTEALTNGWTANAAEVDAIFDGQFATTAANATSGDINLPGWTKVQGIRLLVKDETVDPGLAYTDGKAAVFSWGGTTLTYGEQTGYTLPLNQHSIYELTLKVSGWRDGDMPTYISADMDGTVKTVSPTVAAINTAEGNPFATLKFYVTPTAESSVLKIYGNHHFVIADLSMKLAVAEDMTINDNAEFAQTEEKYANVTLNRSFKKGYNSVVLPFAMTAEQVAAAFGQDAKVYAYSEDSQDPSDATINFNSKDENTIEANVPVLLGGVTETNQITVSSVLVKTAEAKVSGTNFDFVGTYAPMTVENGDYFIGNGAVYKSSGATSMNAFRAYIKAKGASGEVKLFIDGGLATGIDEINGAAVENGAIYNLAGQRVNKAQKGVFIVNGKKVAVK